jgi:predicted ATPase/transcriptional regulator with XRE-family HTH domain
MALERSRAFGELLHEYRRAARLTQEELAARAGLSARTLRKLESGDSQAPRKDTILLLADALGLPPEQQARFVSSARQARVSRQSGGDSYATGVDATEAASPASGGPSATATARHNLPAHLTPLLGREHDEAAAVHLLRREEVRLLTLTGAPGIGKTRLALQVASNLLDMTPDGVFLVELAPITDPTLVLATIMRTVGGRETGGASAAPLAALITRVGTRRMLLLLDNFEQVLAAAPPLVEWLHACPGLRLLVTSRTPLRLRGEHRLAVPPLALPDMAALPSTADELLQYAAIALFVQRAREVKPTFALTAPQAPAVAAICHRLDGLPLAIELAAAWVRLLTPVMLLARLEQRLPLLTAGPRDLPERQQTLRSAIEWSYELLAPTEQVLFRRLAVFVGGWTLEAAEAVYGEASESAAGRSETVLPMLATLVDTSLVDQPEEAANEEVRFRLLELVREFALERLAASGEAEAAAEQHARYYLGLGRQAGVELAGPAMEAWIARLSRENENLRVAFAWAKGHDIASGLHVAGDIWQHWAAQGLFGEGRQCLEELLDLDARAGMIAAPLVRLLAVDAAGNLASYQCDYTSAAQRYQEALTLARAIGQQRLVADILNNLGTDALEQGDYVGARALYEECLALRQETARKLENAVTADSGGHLAIAEVEALWRELGIAGTMEEVGGSTAALADLVRWNQLATAAALGNLGELALAVGDYPRASAFTEQARAVWTELGQDRRAAKARIALGEIAARQGDYERAHALVEPILPQLREMGDKEFTAAALACLGWIAHGHGDAAQALSLYRESLALRREIGNRRGQAESLEGLAMSQAAGRNPASVVRLLSAAMALREAIKVPLVSVDRPAIEQAVADLRAVLGEAAFDAAWSSGRGAPVEQVIADAIRA